MFLAFKNLKSDFLEKCSCKYNLFQVSSFLEFKKNYKHTCRKIRISVTLIKYPVNFEMFGIWPGIDACQVNQDLRLNFHCKI